MVYKGLIYLDIKHLKLNDRLEINEMDRVAGKIHSITGATGMGRADSRLFAQEGGIVIVADCDEERGARLLVKLENRQASCDWMFQMSRIG